MDTIGVYFGLSLLSLLAFGVIGAGMFWIILKWTNRQIRPLDLVRGAASWALGPLALDLLMGAIGGFNVMSLHVFSGILTGLVVAIATRVSLGQADLRLDWGYVFASGFIWGFGFAIMPLSMFLGIGFLISYIIFVLAGIAGSTALVFGLEKYRIANLTR